MRTQHPVLPIVLFSALMLGLPQVARASCADRLPAVEQMSADDAVCLFVKDMRAYRGQRAIVISSAISAGAAAAQNPPDRAAQDRAQKDAERAGAEMRKIAAQVRNHPAFAIYMEARGTSDADHAWKMLTVDTKHLWKEEERGEEREDRRIKRDEMRDYRRASSEDRKSWGRCPQAIQPTEAAKKKTQSDPMEHIYVRVPKTRDGLICYAPTDVSYLYREGFVDQEEWSLEDWQDAMEPFRQSNNVYLLDHDDFLTLRPYRKAPGT